MISRIVFEVRWALARRRDRRLARTGGWVDESGKVVSTNFDQALSKSLLWVNDLAAHEARNRYRATIERPPGWKLLRGLEVLYSTKTFNGVFRPAILDMQQEHLKALAAHKPTLAKWVKFRGYCSVGCAILAQLPVSLVKLILTLWKAAS